MTQSRPFLPIVIALMAVVLYFILKPDDIQYESEPAIQLPDDSPDVYMTNVNITRYDKQGTAVLRARGDSLAIYQENQHSQFNQPVIDILEEGIATWQVSANIAYIDDNNLVEFHQNVIATQLSTSPAITLMTEFLTLNNDAKTIETDLPVQLTQSNQRINAIGMDAKIDTMGSIIHLQSEVSFIYEP